MPSNFTENYALSQWEPGDQVLRADFNSDNAKIDAELLALNQRLDTRGNCQFITGSYVGTGIYGKGNPTVITFPQKPTVVFIYSTGVPAIAFYGASYSLHLSTVSSRALTSTWKGNTLYLYDNTTNSSAGGQLNTDGTTYHYIALVEA